MNEYHSIYALLRWRFTDIGGLVDAEVLARTLTVENMPRDLVPAILRPALTEFRCLRSDARVAKCARFLEARARAEAERAR